MTTALMLSVTEWFCASCAMPPPAFDASPDAAPADASSDVVHVRHALGDSCNGNDDCLTGDTCVTEAQSFPNGTCTRTCQVDGDCGATARCIAPDAAGGRCLVACASQLDCRTREGYRCLPRGPDAAPTDRVCAPTSAPIGTRGDDACFTTTPGPHVLAPLTSRTFGNTVIAPTGSGARADGNLAIGTDGTLVAATLVVGSATSTLDTVTVATGGNAGAFVSVSDSSHRLQADPTVTFGIDGTVHTAWLSYTYAITGTTDTHIATSRSDDHGAHWTDPVTTEADSSCEPLCDKPWLTVTSHGITVAYQSNRFAGLVSQHSTDGGNTWSAPVSLAPDGTVEGSAVRVQLVALGTAPDGTLHAVYAGLADTHTNAPILGDPRNRIVHRVSRDEGASWGADDVVSDVAGGESVVYVQPAITFTRDRVHVVYVAGTRDGAWDVRLASASLAGGAWSYRTVNDEPERCATHTLPSIAGDPSRDVVHVTWLDNRFGTGLVGYARCAGDPAVACGANERIGNADFVFTTSRDPRTWHGDYEGLVLDATGAPWARWSDTRTGTPALYLAHGSVD